MAAIGKTTPLNDTSAIGTVKAEIVKEKIEARCDDCGVFLDFKTKPKTKHYCGSCGQMHGW